MLYSWGEFGHVPELCIFSGIGFVTCCGQFGSGQTQIKLIYFEENVFIECHRSVALMRLYVSVFNQNKLSENKQMMVQVTHTLFCRFRLVIQILSHNKEC